MLLPGRVGVLEIIHTCQKTAVPHSDFSEPFGLGRSSGSNFISNTVRTFAQKRPPSCLDRAWNCSVIIFKRVLPTTTHAVCARRHPSVDIHVSQVMPKKLMAVKNLPSFAALVRMRLYLLSLCSHLPGSSQLMFSLFFLTILICFLEMAYSMDVCFSITH